MPSAPERDQRPAHRFARAAGESPTGPGRYVSVVREIEVRSWSTYVIIGTARGFTADNPSATATLTLAAVGATALAVCSPARADEVAYLVNVTTTPGYNFANADQALAYGRGLCQKVAYGENYSQILGDVKGDFGTVDEYQASYLVSQSAQDLCPNLI
jgi:Protein of unknown function (DUF732)